ncbi:hypothetical protein VP1G_03290 [Cytospora mali]|uniref:Transmembrane protein n=1 Tax=Cytospora mali TaxID=578113 RepID=A0A194UVW9_CYTMA|nr:hypothetical protein VP1G_03290 [Valsa mali var. pyri (nom. inval.)]
MRISSKFATAVLALLLAHPVVSSNGGSQAEEPRGSITTDNAEKNGELRRQLHGRSRWQLHEEVVEVRSPLPDDINAGEAKTTLSTSTTTTTTSNALVARTSSNTWIMIQHVTGTTYSTVTCMTPTTVATNACSWINDKTTTCQSTTAVVPTCLSEKICYFSQNDGALSCVPRGGMPTSGFAVVGVMGLAVAVAVTSITIMCCRDHRARKSMKQAAEAKAAIMAAKAAKKPPRVEVSEVGAVGGDHVPLMSAAGSSNTFAAMPTPGSNAQQQRYGDADPFEEGRHGHYGSPA